MNKLIVVGVLLLLVCGVGVLTNHIKHKKEITITRVYEKEPGFSDLYLVKCRDKKLYTSYPDRLNLDEVCN